MTAVKGCCASGASGSTPSQTIIVDVGISEASVGTPVYVREDTNTPTNPSGTPDEALVDIAAMPEATVKALRLSVTNGRGGWVWPVNLDVDLPDDGFVIEAYFSDIDASSIGGFIMPLADFVGSTVEGVTAGLFSGINNTAAQCRIVSGSYARVAVLSASSQIWNSTPNQSRLQRGPYKMVCEVRRQNGTTPATFVIRNTTECSDGTNVNAYSFSNVVEGITQFNGRTFDAIGIGVWVPAGWGPADAYLDLQRLRILTLP